MLLAFTSDNRKSVFNVFENGKIKKIHNDNFQDFHRHYGLTWNRKNIFVSQQTNILEYDKNFNFTRVVTNETHSGTHQILYKDDIIWVVSTNTNCIHRIHLNGKKDYFLPLEGIYNKLPSELEDTNHYNSILIIDDKLYISAHNRYEPSYILVYHYPSLRLIHRIEGIGRKIHNILVIKDEIFTLDSGGTQSLISNKGFSLKLGNPDQFLRGMACSEDYIFAGCFPWSEDRKIRTGGDSEIVIIDRKSMEISERITVKDVGNINEIRLLDRFDYCHYNAPLLAKIF